MCGSEAQWSPRLCPRGAHPDLHSGRFEPAGPVRTPGWTWGAALLVAMLGACERSSQEESTEAPQVEQPADAAVELARATPAPASGEEGDRGAGAAEPRRVRLDGSSELLALNHVSTGPRVHARHLRVWVYEQPNSSSRRLGYLRAGASSPTSASPAGFAGCPGGWHSVEPAGFVCVGRQATLDGADPVVRAMETFRPRTEAKLPYLYGTVRNPGPVFQRLPGIEELREAEPGVDQRMLEWLDAGGEVGASYAQDVWTWGEPPEDPRGAWTAKLTRGVPDFLQGGGVVPNPHLGARPQTLVIDRMRPKVGYAILDTFFHEGRRYGLTTHAELVPTDRLRPIQGSDFQGVRIGVDVEFPFAFVRRPEAKFVDASGADAGAATYRGVLRLTGKQKFFGKVLHYEAEDGRYISDRHASRLDPAKRMPGWAKAGEKWIDINITKQTLMLYEGTTAVFATLVSTGEAGLASAETTTATRRGIFRIHTKHVTATMASNESGEEFELRDVPYVQYFEADGYALHGAYWHDRFGMPKSRGCINLTPEDARRVFHWTDPQVPTGWHGALLPLRGTVVFIHP